jgi:hypothetical protein
VPGLVLEVPGALLLAVIPGEAHQLPRSGERGDVEVEGTDAQFAVFDATVVGLDLGGPVGGPPVKLVTGDLVKGGLIVLESKKDVGAGTQAGQRRFFWQ